MLKKLLILTLLFSIPALARTERGSLGLNVNSNNLELQGRISLATRTDRIEYRNFYLDANFINGDDDTLWGLGFYVENSPHQYQNLEFSFGLRSVFTGNDKLDKSFIALPIVIGGKARMYFQNLPKSALGIKLAYAPKPLTFSDGESYLEFRIQADMEIIDNIDIYLGYRNIGTDYKGKGEDVTFNSAPYIGFKFVF